MKNNIEIIDELIQINEKSNDYMNDKLAWPVRSELLQNIKKRLLENNNTTFRYFLQSVYLSDNPDHGIQDFDIWLDSNSYQDICDYWEEYLENEWIWIEDLFNLN